LTSKLTEFDEEVARLHNAKILIGVDEVGRGPIAGPVTVCACIVPSESYELLGEVNDSKKISPKKRRKIFELLKSCGASFSITSIPPKTIDEINILQATFLAMRQSIEKLGIEPSEALVLVDGNNAIPGLEFPQVSVIKGDSKSLCIASASVIAKVVRDEYMEKLDEAFPGYMFSTHKGYGTKAHYEALEKHGLCPEHRKSFIHDITGVSK
jgi:ribonuclease HII